MNLADLWSKYEQESGVKFDIQRDLNSKTFQQPKDDALPDFDTDHVTENLITTVSKKSKSYLEAAKGNLADNNNNKHFPQGLLWTEDLWKMREKRLLNHPPLVGG